LKRSFAKKVPGDEMIKENICAKSFRSGKRLLETPLLGVERASAGFEKT